MQGSCISTHSYRFCKFTKGCAKNMPNDDFLGKSKKALKTRAFFDWVWNLGLDSEDDVAEDIADRGTKQGENNNHDNGY